MGMPLYVREAVFNVAPAMRLLVKLRMRLKAENQSQLAVRTSHTEDTFLYISHTPPPVPYQTHALSDKHHAHSTFARERISISERVHNLPKKHTPNTLLT